MQDQKDTSRVFDSSNLIIYLYKWRIPLLGVAVLAAILAAIFSGPSFIDPKYKSTVTIFPTTTNSLSKALLPQQFASRGQDILEFGAEEEAEQLLQILNSDEIRNRIIERYNLMDHYGIDSNSRFVRTEMYDNFDDNISFERTEFMSIEISVLDTDPDTAALIANDIVLLLDEAKNRIQKERALQGLKIIEGEYEELKNEVLKLEDSLTALRYKGVHDYEGQSAVYSEQLAFEIASNGEDSWQARGIKVKLDTLAKYGGPYVSIRDELQYLRGQMVQIKTRLDQARVDVEQFLPASFKVNLAYPAEKKSYPTRWLIVAISALGAFVFTLIVILILDTIRHAKAQEA